MAIKRRVKPSGRGGMNFGGPMGGGNSPKPAPQRGGGGPAKVYAGGSPGYDESYPGGSPGFNEGIEQRHKAGDINLKEMRQGIEERNLNQPGGPGVIRDHPGAVRQPGGPGGIRKQPGVVQRPSGPGDSFPGRPMPGVMPEGPRPMPGGGGQTPNRSKPAPNRPPVNREDDVRQGGPAIRQHPGVRTSGPIDMKDTNNVDMRIEPGGRKKPRGKAQKFKDNYMQNRMFGN